MDIIAGVVLLIIGLIIIAATHEADDPAALTSLGLFFILGAGFFIFMAGGRHAVPDVPKGNLVRVLTSYALPSGQRAIEVEIAPDHRITRVEEDIDPNGWKFPEKVFTGQLLIRVNGKSLVVLADSTRLGP